MTVGEREAADLARGRAYIAAGTGAGRHLGPQQGQRGEARPDSPQPTSLTAALFGPYTCTRCPSYGHKTSDHGEQP